MSNPYRGKPGYAFWRSAVATPAMSEVDPVVALPFSIAASDKVVSAGSCFAQHISRYLSASGFNYFVTEPAHPLIAPHIRSFNYGTFSARYGNIYTARQLLQLVQRAYGRFAPAEDVWAEADGRFIDPFRPQIQPGGFGSQQELLADRKQHLAAVRRAFEELDVFVFTFGLTEAWRSRADGAVFPLCPGVAGGAFDPAKHEFVNFTAEETAADAIAVIDELRRVNPKARVVLTVSPVPLAATAESRHILVSTVYSKAALRVACETVIKARGEVAYFPSYEIVTGQHTRGAYFADDLRSVTEAGVAQVMKIFMRHFCGLDAAQPAAIQAPTVDRHTSDMAAVVQVDCDEDALERQNS